MIFIFLAIKERKDIFHSLKLPLKQIGLLFISGTLIISNWLMFVWAVNNELILATSLGYFINPLINILFGVLFLSEKLNNAQKTGLLIAASTTIYLGFYIGEPPWIAIFLAVTFGLYGLLRKQIDGKSEIGLLYESGFISVIAAPYIAYLTYNEIGYFINSSTTNSILLILTGAITIFPLFFFNLGVRFIPLGFAGVLFFLTPTLHFLTSAFILNEDINTSKLISFIIIWVAVIIFIIDALREEKKVNESNIQLLS